MTKDEILASAPDKNLTHYDGNYYWQYTNDNGWCRYCNPIAKTVVGEPSSGMRSLSDIRRIVELEKRIAEVEQWVAAIADDHEQIPDWIQQSARSLLASGAGMSNECLKMSNALKIANKRIDELERYNLGLANESHNKTMAIERFKKRLSEVERELDELIVFSQHLIDCHKNGIQCLVDIDYSEFAGKFAIEQQIKGATAFAAMVVDTGQFGWSDSQWLTDFVEEYADQLHQQLNGSE